MRRWLPLLAIGSLAMVLIWLIVPLNNYLLGNAFIADDYLMPASVVFTLLLVLCANPLLRLFSRRFTLTRPQLAVLFGVVMVACLVPSSGLLRTTLHPIAYTVYRSNTDAAIANAYEVLSPPPSLFPDTLEYGADIPVITPYMDELGPGESIPWRAWIPPLIAWMGFVAPFFLMMVALAILFLGYWRDTERTPFPLVNVMQRLIEVPESGRLPRLFKNGLFWTACITVFSIHATYQINKYFPNAVPLFPLRWDISSCFTEEPLKHIAWWMNSGVIYFTFLGIGYFMPRRTSFSIWFFQVVYAFYVMIGRAYFPPFQYSVVREHRIGAFLAFAIFILWLARRHLAHIGRSMLKLGRVRGDDRALGIAGYLFVVGLLGMFAWLMWVNVPPVWAAVLSLTGVLFALTLTRVIAETGLPLFFPDPTYMRTILLLIPAALRNAAGMYFGGLLSLWYTYGQSVCVGTVVTQALGLNRDHKPRHHLRLGMVFMLVLLLSVVGAGIVHLNIAYRNSSTLDGRPIAGWGRGAFGQAEQMLLHTVRGTVAQDAAEHVPNLLFGGALTGILYGLCQIFPQWPIHPVGLLCVGTYSITKIWPNIFFAWLLKSLILKYGGSQMHRKAGDFFIGLILGEVFAIAFWCSVAGVRAAMGLSYFYVTI